MIRMFRGAKTITNQVDLLKKISLNRPRGKILRTSEYDIIPVFGRRKDQLNSLIFLIKIVYQNFKIIHLLSTFLFHILYYILETNLSFFCRPTLNSILNAT